MSSSSLDLAVNPKEYFRQKICAAARKNNISVSEDVEYYLVNLLCDFIVPDKVTTVFGEHSIIDTPLALIQKKALEAPPEEKIKIFKSLGDASLYISGYFEDFFNRKTFTVEYFINLGSNAYSSVSDLLQQMECRSHFRDFTRLYPTLQHTLIFIPKLVQRAVTTRIC